MIPLCLPECCFLEAGLVSLSLPPDFNWIGPAACERCLQLQSVDLSHTQVTEILGSTFSHAAGPIHVKSGGKVNEVKPASRKQHSGKTRVNLAGLYSDFSKSRCRKAVHFSKARGINSACGAN